MGSSMKVLVVLPLIGFTDPDYCIHAGRMYRSCAYSRVKNGGGWFGLDRGFVLKSGSSEPLNPPPPPMATGIGNVAEVTYLQVPYTFKFVAVTDQIARKSNSLYFPRIHAFCKIWLNWMKTMGVAAF